MARHLLLVTLTALLCLSLGVLLGLCNRAVYADHNVYLPGAPGTPLMQNIIRTQDYNYCLDARSSAYPNFASQLADVVAQYEARTGIRGRQVAFGDGSCEVQHLMPDGLSCDGWAGRIYYSLVVVRVEYCYRLGYSDWRSTHGHELGHGLLGLHEQYRDSGGSIGCTRRTDTVMDCGSGVRYPTPLDVSRGCAIIATAWCGQEPQPPPPCEPCWDGEAWLFSSGWRFFPNSSCGDWYDPQGRHMWGDCNDSWNGRYVPALDIWDSRGDTFFFAGEWRQIP